jgi:hypothetical protein
MTRTAVGAVALVGAAVSTYQHETGDADPAREVGIVEIDSAEPLRTKQHAQAEERDQQRQAEPLRSDRCNDSEQEHSARQEDPLVRQASTSSRWSARRYALLDDAATAAR